jgi:hypothetical protein
VEANSLVVDWKIDPPEQNPAGPDWNSLRVTDYYAVRTLAVIASRLIPT